MGEKNEHFAHLFLCRQKFYDSTESRIDDGFI